MRLRTASDSRVPRRAEDVKVVFAGVDARGREGRFDVTMRIRSKWNEYDDDEAVRGFFRVGARDGWISHAEVRTIMSGRSAKGGVLEGEVEQEVEFSYE